MSKAERLHRWADSLELQEQLQREAFSTRDGGCSTQAESSPLTVALEDWAFQAEGLRDGGLENALAFFDLSEGEMRRIIDSSRGSRTISAAVAARRVRALAKEAEGTTAPQVDEPGAGDLNVLSARSRARSSAPAGRGRQKEAARAAPLGSDMARRVREVSAPRSTARV